jgi:glycosyltransferase involved in cell wall biosynthesis
MSAGMANTGARLGGGTLQTAFDAVVMLTWSDWKTEPRSNRYHYATRFAAWLPVYFVQPDGAADVVTFDPVGGHDITLVHIADDYGAGQTSRLARALRSRGVRRPLLWVYNALFEHYLRRCNARFVVYHASEDYFCNTEDWAVCSDAIRPPLMRALSTVDLLVGVSESVTESYRRSGYRGRALTLRNGCDFGFWRASAAAAYVPPSSGAKVALFQGGINARLDYRLLFDLVDRKPEWQFWFCGQAASAGGEWSQLAARRNVFYYGQLTPDGIADLARQARIGLIPFKQDPLIRGSLPLKAYEYVACGLPVVTVPIDALASRPDLFRTETTPAGFAGALDELAPSRTDENMVARRLQAAALESYDECFQRLDRAIGHSVASRSRAVTRLNLLLLYDDSSVHVRTISEHIEAIQKYSRHNVTLMPATGTLPGFDYREVTPDFGMFDAVLIHYSVRVSLEQHISASVARAVEAYDGPKLLFIQDEYENTETARRWMERLGIDAVFTNVPLDQIECVYPRARFPEVDFLTTLTGYVPEDHNLDSYALPIAERVTLIGYRGRQLPHHYGQLGFEKYRIGVEMKRQAAARGLAVDIEVDDAKRIYGNDWYAFLGSCRATLGTESGANVFDHDGSLKRLAAAHADLAFPEFARRFLAGRDGEVAMNQVSPKIFEAIRLRTALILFAGDYSGVVKPGVHYILLENDFSNVDDVFGKVQDVAYLEEMTARAYADVIEGGRYSYEAFVKEIDAYLDRRTRLRARAKIVSVPVAAAFQGEAATLLPQEQANGLMSGVMLDPNGLPRQAVHALVAQLRGHPGMSLEGQRAGIAYVNLAGSLENTAVRAILKHVAIRILRRARSRKAILKHVAIRILRRARSHVDGSRYSRVLRRARSRADGLRRRTAERIGIVLALCRDAEGIKLLARCTREPRAVRPFLAEAARLILARDFITAAGTSEAIALTAIVTDDQVEIHGVPQSVAMEIGLSEIGRQALAEARSRGIERFTLAVHSTKAPRPRLLANDRYPLPNLARWLAARPDTVNRLVFGQDGAPAPSPGTPSAATDGLKWISAATRYPDLVPLLHDIHRRALGTDLAAPLDRAVAAQQWRPVAAPRRRSVLFLNQCYYNFKYLAAALRERGWDAVVANLHPPEGSDAKYFHGEDLSLYVADPAEFGKRLQAFFNETCERFGIVHSYGVGALGLFPEMWDRDPLHAAIPWDILEWRRRGILIGYTPTGCLDGVAQSTFGAWSPTCCARCSWRDRPDICSDAKNRAWGRKREMLVDLIALDCGPAIDFNASEKAFRGPLTAAVDPDVWHPDLEPPEHLRRARTRDDEVVVYHGVGNYAARTRDGINAKGTHAVVSAIDALREEGIPIRLDFVDDVPSIDNRFVQVQADIIIDQLNHGRYGATAREGMMLGKPVVARINPWDGDGVPATRCILETPVVNADEVTIKDVLRDLALDPAKRAAIGRASREHALKWCAAPSLAERFERVYDSVRDSGRPPSSLD